MFANQQQKPTLIQKHKLIQKQPQEQQQPHLRNRNKNSGVPSKLLKTSDMDMGYGPADMSVAGASASPFVVSPPNPALMAQFMQYLNMQNAQMGPTNCGYSNFDAMDTGLKTPGDNDGGNFVDEKELTGNGDFDEDDGDYEGEPPSSVDGDGGEGEPSPSDREGSEENGQAAEEVPKKGNKLNVFDLVDDSVIILSGEAFKQLYTEMAKQTEMMNKLLNAFGNLNVVGGPVVESENDVDFSKLPVKNIGEMAALEEKLADKNARQNFLKKVEAIGGNKMTEVVRRAMAKIISDECCLCYTLRGNKTNKESFEKTELCQVIKDAVLNNPLVEKKEHMIELEIGKYLTGAQVRINRKTGNNLPKAKKADKTAREE